MVKVASCKVWRMVWGHVGVGGDGRRVESDPIQLFTKLHRLPFVGPGWKEEMIQEGVITTSARGFDFDQSPAFVSFLLKPDNVLNGVRESLHLPDTVNSYGRGDTEPPHSERVYSSVG